MLNVECRRACVLFFSRHSTIKNPSQIQCPTPHGTFISVSPAPLSVLAACPREMTLAVVPPVTQRTVLDALEAAHPRLIGTLRDRSTGLRRPLVRFFACEEDLSHESPDAPLPAAIAEGREPFHIIGAIAGG